MLLELNIRDFAIIDRLSLRLDAGFNVLTGETGAGKSIIIDALGLLRGERVDPTFVRAGSERARVEGVFSIADCPELTPLLTEYGLWDDDDEQVILTREISAESGRSVARVNGRAVNATVLREVGGRLVDIHGQHEHHSLLARASQQRLLDEYGGHRELAEQVAAAYAGWRECRDELESLRASAGERRDRQQLLNYQLGELAELALGANESEELEHEQKRLANAGELTRDVEQVLALCEGGEEGGGGLDGLRRA